MTSRECPKPKNLSFEYARIPLPEEDNSIFICPKCKSHKVKLQPFNTAIAKCEDCGYRWNTER